MRILGNDMIAKGMTVAIVTMNRPTELRVCLTSLIKQTILPERVIVIDNDPGRSASTICNDFKSTLSIEYSNEKQKGVAYARNLALRRCQTKYLAFVDDDCRLDRAWVEVASKGIRKTRCVYLLGESLMQGPSNIIAESQFVRQAYWFHYKIPPSGQTNPYIFDTKNVVLRYDFIIRNRIIFNPEFCINRYDSSDTDFGFKLHSRGQRGKYEPRMIVYHKETGTVVSFFKKAFTRGRLGLLLARRLKFKNKLLIEKHANWRVYFRDAKEYWPQEYPRYLPYMSSRGRIRKFCVFLLIKLYDLLYLRGYIHQAKILRADTVS